MSLLFKNYSLVEVIYLLIWFNKTKSFQWNTKNTDRNSANEKNTQTTHRENYSFTKGWLVLENYPFFWNNTRTVFWKISKNLRFELMAWWLSGLEHLNGIQWPWVQIPLRPTFYSYFKESFSGEYHIYIYTIYIYIYI